MNRTQPQHESWVLTHPLPGATPAIVAIFTPLLTSEKKLILLK